MDGPVERWPGEAARGVVAEAPHQRADRTGKEVGGGADAIGHALFTTYLLPFEVTSILILIAIIGAVVLARKEID